MCQCFPGLDIFFSEKKSMNKAGAFWDDSFPAWRSGDIEEARISTGGWGSCFMVYLTKLKRSKSSQNSTAASVLTEIKLLVKFWKSVNMIQEPIWRSYHTHTPIRKNYCLFFLFSNLLRVQWKNRHGYKTSADLPWFHPRVKRNNSKLPLCHLFQIWPPRRERVTLLCFTWPCL